MRRENARQRGRSRLIAQHGRQFPHAPRHVEVGFELQRRHPPAQATANVARRGAAPIPEIRVVLLERRMQHPAEIAVQQREHLARAGFGRQFFFILGQEVVHESVRQRGVQLQQQGVEDFDRFAAHVRARPRDEPRERNRFLVGANR
jgi:hypothetical protein